MFKTLFYILSCQITSKILLDDDSCEMLSLHPTYMHRFKCNLGLVFYYLFFRMICIQTQPLFSFRKTYNIWLLWFASFSRFQKFILIKTWFPFISSSDFRLLFTDQHSFLFFIFFNFWFQLNFTILFLYFFDAFWVLFLRLISLWLFYYFRRFGFVSISFCCHFRCQFTVSFRSVMRLHLGSVKAYMFTFCVRYGAFGLNWRTLAFPVFFVRHIFLVQSDHRLAFFD